MGVVKCPRALTSFGASDTDDSRYLKDHHTCLRSMNLREKSQKCALKSQKKKENESDKHEWYEIL
jgi:hypothetical protein